MSEDSERLTKLETVNEVYLKKIVEGLEALTTLSMNVKEAKAFIDSFESKVKKIIDERLNTIEFDKAIKETIQGEVTTILHSKNMTKDFVQSVEAIVDRKNKEQLLSLYLKITMIVTTIATGLVLTILKGWV